MEQEQNDTEIPPAEDSESSTVIQEVIVDGIKTLIVPHGFRTYVIQRISEASCRDTEMQERELHIETPKGGLSQVHLLIHKAILPKGVMRISGDFSAISIVSFTGYALSLEGCWTEYLTLSDISVRHLKIEAATRTVKWTGINVELLNCLLTAAAPENRSDNAAVDSIDILTPEEDPVPGRSIEAPVRVSHLIRVQDPRLAAYFRLMCPNTPIACSGEI